jgi:hypothetical protein
VSSAEVWERYVRPDLWSSWSPQIQRVEIEVDRLVAGAAGRVVGPLGVYVDFTIDALDEAAREWSWSVRPGLLARPTLRLAHGVLARDGGSETWLRVSGPLPVVLGYLPVARLALHRLVH